MNDAILDVSEGEALKGVHDQRPGPPPAATGDANDLDVLADVPNEKVARLKTRQARRVPSHFDLLLHRDNVLVDVNAHGTKGNIFFERR